jgi:hypothetical protein
MTATTTRRVNGAHVWSMKTRRRVLAALQDRALAGDPAAAEVLLRYGDPAGRLPATSLPAGSDRD